MPFGFDCFAKLRLLFRRKVLPRHFVGVPSTEINFSMQCARLSRRNRKGSVFLASSNVSDSSLLPCFLDVHRPFSSDRHPSSVSVALNVILDSPEDPSSVCSQSRFQVGLPLTNECSAADVNASGKREHKIQPHQSAKTNESTHTTFTIEKHARHTLLSQKSGFERTLQMLALNNNPLKKCCRGPHPSLPPAFKMTYGPRANLYGVIDHRNQKTTTHMHPERSLRIGVKNT